MADCTKTVEFIRELVRMCDSNDACSSCPLHDAKHGACRRTPAESLSEDTIAIVQKWSDEHPMITWEGKLKELLPNAKDDTLESIMHSFCPSDIFGAAGNCECDEDAPCADCWAKEYKEEP